ncbi:hypothetical protein C1645_739813 [Glomus cerebriforme]|uniref:Galactose oxidase n=1 Tax=Glomus cerebriforme TaxID=658196 RepID=A0A397STB5_9GLOM|nr:hypothetical protein C1645_739813 [Glomus cerebriforme]
MSKNYLVLWIIFQLLIEINCQMTPFKPTVSNKHTATLIDNKLYILGGDDVNTNYIDKSFFYLDFSVPFNTQNLLWQDLSNIDSVPSHSEAASVRGGANNDTLFLYGGHSNDQTIELVYTFDPQSIKWSIPKIAEINSAIRKSEVTGVNYNGKMYLWGGFNRDTINISWGKGSLVNAPTPRSLYGATLLPNNNIIYMGGTDTDTITYNLKTFNIIQGNAFTLSEVYLYDTINDNWSIKTTSGKIPSNRAVFSTVLGLDGQRVIIFGGMFNNPGYLDTTLYVLDLTNFNWYVPKSSGNIPNSRIYHKANVIGKYMVISFGLGYDNSTESDILLLDISNNEEYIWTTSFVPTVPNNMPPSSSSSSSPSSSLSPTNNIPVIAGATVGSLFGIILLSFGSFFLYKRNKKSKQKDILRIQGNENHERAIRINENSTDHEPIIPTSLVNRIMTMGKK